MEINPVAAFIFAPPEKKPSQHFDICLHICQKEPLETLWTYLSYEGSRQSEMLTQLKVEDDILTLLPEDKSYPSSFGNDSDDKIGEEDKKKIILQLVSITNLAFLEILNITFS